MSPAFLYIGKAESRKIAVPLGEGLGQGEMNYRISAGDEEGSEAGVCFVMSYVKSEPGSMNVHLSSSASGSVN